MLDLLKLWRNGTTHERDRRERSAIGLMVALIWTVNALNHRPKDMAGERAMLSFLLPWRNGLDGVARPVREQGVLFFNGLLYNLGNYPIPRLMVVTSDSDLQRMIGNSVTVETLRLRLPSAIVARRRRDPNEEEVIEAGRVIKRARSNNKAPMTAIVRVPKDAPNPFNYLRNDFVMESASSVDDFLSALHQLWLQFQGDMMEKFPYARSMGSYASFDGTNKTRYAPKLFQQCQLHEVFRCCAVRTGQTVWDHTFNSCFPEDGEYKGAAQGYDQCRWTSSWSNLHQKSPGVNFEMMRRAIRVKWDELAWVSWATSGKIWNTGCNKIKSAITIHNTGMQGPAPIIVENPERPDCLQWRSAVVGGTAWMF
jgi:hypothetical protein